MKKRVELTPEMLAAYEGVLRAREAAARAEIKKNEKHLARIASRLANLEGSLRAEITEGSLGVLKAIGLPTPPRKSKEEVEAAVKKIESVETILKPQEETKKGSGWWV